MFAKKSLGQHFLRNRNILQKIAGAAEITTNDTVLEVGPGDGALTAFLLELAERVVAVEKDARLISLLRKRFASEIESEKLTVVYGDILNLNIDSTKKTAPDVGGFKHLVRLGGNYKIVANIPYYITGQFLRKFLQSDTQPSMMVLLLQKEVAKRIIGITNPASSRLRRASARKESILSISVKCYGMPRYIATVKAGSFSPPPKVDSAILKIDGISKEFFNIEPSPPFLRGSTPSGARGEGVGIFGKTTPPPAAPPLNQGRVEEMEKRFFSVLKRGFAHPRKLLASNLGVAKEIVAQCGIAENARAENVMLEQWKHIALL